MPQLFFKTSHMSFAMPPVRIKQYGRFYLKNARIWACFDNVAVFASHLHAYGEHMGSF
jgi:hypothetical protein